jgi:hypothetical protein
MKIVPQIHWKRKFLLYVTHPFVGTNIILNKYLNNILIDFTEIKTSEKTGLPPQWIDEVNYLYAHSSTL